MLIKVTEERSNADVLGKLRKKVNCNVTGSRLVIATAMQRGHVYDDDTAGQGV